MKIMELLGIVLMLFSLVGAIVIMSALWLTSYLDEKRDKENDNHDDSN
jgi:hypothetical protein